MTMGTEEPVGGESLVSYNRRPRTFRAGRMCRYEGCTTRLSIYNSDDYCSFHAGRDTEHFAMSLLNQQIEAERATEAEQASEPAPVFSGAEDFQAEIAS